MKNALLAVIMACALLACKNEQNAIAKKNAVPPEKPVALPDSTPAPAPALEIKYYALRGKDSIAQIDKYFNDSQQKIIFAINRIDKAKLYGADMLAIPDTFLYNLRYYSPYPDSIPLLDTVKKIILVSYPSQALGMYENGKLLRWAPVSLGKKTTPTPTGLLHTNWKAKQTVSTDDSSWILKWYFNLDNFRGVSLHLYELPGHPASHACIRLYEEDAEWIYNWAEQWKLDSAQRHVRAYGTPVIIFGSYDFDAAPPWYNLPANPHQLLVTTDTLAKEINRHLPLILQRQAVRDSILTPPLTDSATTYKSEEKGLN